MKKLYVRPDAAFETFNFMQSIAAGACYLLPGDYDGTPNSVEDTCGFATDDGEVVFVAKPVCSDPQDGCYNLPEDDLRIFAS